MFIKQIVSDETDLIEDETYEIEKVWQDEKNLDFYFRIMWNIELFKINNPSYLDVEIKNSHINFATDKKLKSWNTYNDFLKSKTRENIDINIWDIYDLIADIDKRLWLVERMSIRVSSALINWDNIQENPNIMWYKDMLNQYVYMVDNWLVVWRSDLENLSELFTNLIENTNKISTIVKTEYLDKKI